MKVLQKWHKCLPAAAQVEMTVSKGVLRIGGTIIGGTLGFLVMLRSDIASDPFLTTLFAVLFSFVFGLAGRTQYL